MRKLLTVGLMALCAVATANCCDLDGCFEVGGEALYWKPTGADWQYALVTPGTLTTFPQETKRVVGDYDWGFRIFGSYYSDDCCDFMTLDWTYLRTKDADSTSSSSEERITPWLTSQSFYLLANVTSHLRFDYDKVNVRFGRGLCSGCNSRLLTYGGARYVEIQEIRDYLIRGNLLSINNVTDSYHEQTRFQGGGLEVGFGGEYELWCDFNIVANIGLTAEVGKVKNSSKEVFEGTVTNISTRHVPSRTICVPGAELRLGLSYTYKCDCWWITGDVGYQMDYRWNAIAILQGQMIQTALGNIPTSKRTSVGFGGLYFGLRARF